MLAVGPHALVPTFAEQSIRLLESVSPWPVVRRTEQPGWSSSRVHCKSAWGPEADWHHKLLICLAFEGAFFGADLHPVVLHTYYDDVRGGDQVVQRLR